MFKQIQWLKNRLLDGNCCIWFYLKLIASAGVSCVLYLGLLQIVGHIFTFDSRDLGLLMICMTFSHLIWETWTLLRHLCSCHKIRNTFFVFFTCYEHSVCIVNSYIKECILGLLGANMSQTLLFAILAGLPKIISRLISLLSVWRNINMELYLP